jgi:hypothetical protein
MPSGSDERGRITPEEVPMAQAAAAPIPVPTPTIPAIPVWEILPWAVFVGLLASIALYFVSSEQEQGAFSVFAGTGIHE